jgi:hypothetical protein
MPCRTIIKKRRPGPHPFTMESGIKLHKQRIAKREKVLKRLQFKGKGNDIMAQMIQADIDGQRQAIETIKKNLETAEEVLKLLDEYEYSADADQIGGAIWIMAAP